MYMRIDMYVSTYLYVTIGVCHCLFGYVVALIYIGQNPL